jgi:hypothetical protein
MILGGTNEDAMTGTSKRLAKNKKFWEKADKLNKCPFE